MLVLRYFGFVGGALLALLLVCAATLPKPPATEGTIESTSDVPAIRIHSDRKWPERVVFDTNAAIPAPANTAQPLIRAEQPVSADAAARARLAFAQILPDDGRSSEAKQAVDLRKSDPRQWVKRKVARVRVAPQPRYYGYPPYGYPQYGASSRMMVAQQPHFGLFW
jgi:hypothetical protein